MSREDGKMSAFSDDHLAQFRLQSDRAFAEMQANADREMANFLRLYGGQVSLSASSAPTPVRAVQQAPQRAVGPAPQAVPAPQQTPAPQQAPRPQQAPTPQQAPATQNPNIFPTDDAESLFEATGADFGALSRENVQDSVQDIKEDLGKLSSSLREESRQAAREAVRGTSDILKNKSFDLAKRAKEEAAALKAAAQQAMQEERELKALRGRAAEEARKAKERMRQQADEVKDDMVEDLRGLAQDKLDFLKGKATEAFRTGQQSINREIGDLKSGRDTPT